MYTATTMKELLTILEIAIQKNWESMAIVIGDTLLPPASVDPNYLIKLGIFGTPFCLEEFPTKISQLTNLRLLAISNNPFTSLPPNIGRLNKLASLDLSNNKITVLPSEIGQLTDLISLDLSNNQLTSLPPEIGHLTKLKYLNLRNNNLDMPPEILKKADQPQVIIKYFATHRRQPLNEAKLILIGQGSVGKTSLAKRLTKNNYNPLENKTDGIAIEKWDIKVNKENVCLNVWDFGGQEIMHATHQFFLTKRSLYLLVLDARLTQEENRTEYWLKLIQSFGGDSPVIIVGNKTDQHPLDIDRRGLLIKYPNIRHFIETSCANGQGILNLRKAITNEVADLPHIHDTLPLTWFNIKDKLATLKKNYITYAEYETLCKRGGINDEISQRTLIGFLHDLGVVLSFREDPRLQDTNILNPEWVTNGVYHIINSNTLFQNSGVLQLSQLGEILDPHAYPRARHTFVVDMMKKFELCYAFEGSDDQYLIPDLLPKDEPFTGEWTDALGFEYHYNVLPTNIISRFIVRMHPFIHQNTVWRSGVALKSGENIALIKADYEDRKISIRVNGAINTRRDMLAMIRGTFDAIHQTITRLEVSPKVPHPKYPNLILDYSELITFERNRVIKFPRKVKDKVVNINVRQLLTGVESSKSAQVFISYSHQDIDFAIDLATSLAKAEISIWQDIESLKGGEIWADEIEKGLLLSKMVLVIISPSANKSDWVKKEYTYALTAKRKVVPLLYKDCDIPFLLNNIQYIDFSKQDYNLALNELIDVLKKEK